ncbi:MAG: hypothetical protein KC549_15395, partial [Myxococcales bacterium]|nr:hypothetical protein [Myxococcales bacterium]
MRLLCLAALVGGLIASAHAAPPGDADAAPAAKTGVSSILGTLDWGVSTTAVLKSLEDELEARYDERLRKADTLDVDRILRLKRADLKQIKDSLVRFDGQRTGFEASIVAEDFRSGNGEAMLKVEDGPAQRYFFFKDEQLWKVLVIYSSNVARQLDFAGFVGQVEGKRGKAASRQMDPKDAKRLMSATWEDDLTRLVVQDRSLFGTYAMMFLDKARGVPIEEGRAPRANALQPVADARADSMIADIMAEGGGAENNVVDKITGQAHAVELEMGGGDLLPLRR